jgi:hypothetical protein
VIEGSCYYSRVQHFLSSEMFKLERVTYQKFAGREGEGGDIFNCSFLCAESTDFSSQISFSKSVNVSEN